MGQSGSCQFHRMIDRSPFYRSRGHELSPRPYPHALDEYRADEKLILRAAVLDGVPGDPDRPGRTAVSLSSRDGALGIMESDFALAGVRLLLGGWGYSAHLLHDDGVRRGRSAGAYLRGEAKLREADGNAPHGFGELSVRWRWPPPDTMLPRRRWWRPVPRAAAAFIRPGWEIHAGGMVLLERIELSTSPLPRECSTTELQQHSMRQRSAVQRPPEPGLWPCRARVVKPGLSRSRDFG